MPFRKPESTDALFDHAEQHGHAFDEINALKTNKSEKDHNHDANYAPDGHDHADYAELDHGEHVPEPDPAVHDNHALHYSAANGMEWIDASPFTYDDSEILRRLDEDEIELHQDTDDIADLQSEISQIKTNHNDLQIHVDNHLLNHPSGGGGGSGGSYDDTLIWNAVNNKYDKTGGPISGAVTINSQESKVLEIEGNGSSVVVYNTGTIAQNPASDNVDKNHMINRSNLDDAMEIINTEIEQLNSKIEFALSQSEVYFFSVTDQIDVEDGEVSLDNLTWADLTKMTFSDKDLKQTPINMSKIMVGDTIRVIETHSILSDFSVRDFQEKADFNFEVDPSEGYMNAEVTAIDRSKNELTIEVKNSEGTVSMSEVVMIEHFAPQAEIDLTNYTTYDYVDEQLKTKSNTGHTHSYASSSHSHSYASTSHTHSTIFKNGTSTNPSLSKGEPYLNTSQKVVYVGL